jgi:hypothetical protein
VSKIVEINQSKKNPFVIALGPFVGLVRCACIGPVTVAGNQYLRQCAPIRSFDRSSDVDCFEPVRKSRSKNYSRV